MTVSERIEQLKSEALSAVSSSASTADLEDVRVRFLGRSAELTEIKKAIGTLSPEERKEVGRSSNLASREIEAALGRTDQDDACSGTSRLHRLSGTRISSGLRPDAHADVSPGRGPRGGQGPHARAPEGHARRDGPSRLRG